MFELFFPAGDDFFRMIQESVRKWSLEITIETADENLRKLDTLKFPVPNSKIEDTIASASVARLPKARPLLHGWNTPPDV